MEKTDAATALVVALFGILLYVAARFEFRYGMGAVIALLHDIPITLGIMVPLDVRIDLTVVAAFLLTIIGYSLNDTIVVPDRIRDRHKLAPEDPMGKVIDDAIAEPQELYVVMTTFDHLISGGNFISSVVRCAFSLTLIIGLILGTYSLDIHRLLVLLFLDLAAVHRAVKKADSDVTPEYGPGAEFEASKPELAKQTLVLHEKASVSVETQGFLLRSTVYC